MVENSKKFHGYMNSPLGVIEVVCSSDALLSVSYVENLSENDNNELLEKVLLQLTEYFNGKRTNFDIPVHFSGTEFQKKAWLELINIPFGDTIYYQEQAIKIGKPKAIRAIGSANSKNKISIIVPCHRVIGKSGDLVGYAGGLSRKKWLIEHEKRIQQ